MNAIGWALLIGNLVFQSIRSMTSGLGFEGEGPKLLFTRTFGSMCVLMLSNVVFFKMILPNYSGDGPYEGGIEHGGGYGNDIDVSGFTSIGTKNAHDLAAYAIQAYENNWGYVWGTYGCVLTESLYQYKLRQYPQGVGNYAQFIRDNWLGRRTADCVRLIRGYDWTCFPLQTS